MTLDLKYEKDGKQVGEVVVGVSDQLCHAIPPGMELPPGTSEK